MRAKVIFVNQLNNRFVEGKLKSRSGFLRCGKISQKGELYPPGSVRFSSILIETRLVRRTGAKDSGELT